MPRPIVRSANPISAHALMWSLYVTLSVLGFCSPLRAFIISVHRAITEAALAAFSDAQISKSDKGQIIQGSTDADLVEGDLPITGGPYEGRFHFDNDFSYDAVLANYVTIARLVDRNLAKPEHDPWEFGKILHAIEDFYSHSNYIPLYRDYVAQNGNELVGSVPTIEEVLSQPKEYEKFLPMLRRDLHTGRYPLPKWHLMASESDHGWPIGAGMNKDTLQRPLFADARESAVRSAMWYLRLYTKNKEATRKWKVFKSKLPPVVR
jgi:hypothetical protein